MNGYCEPCAEVHDSITWHLLGMVCGRCRQHTGNNTQGHYWALCKVRLAEGASFQQAIGEFHFCCPGFCELSEPGGSVSE